MVIGTFPKRAKVAMIKPIFKTGLKNDFANYRPISILSVVGKILEKVIKIRLEGYIIKNKIITPNQYGFLTGSNTLAALANSISNIQSALDKGEKVSGVFLDLKKAFDSVNFDILFFKMRLYGIRGTALNLFQSYLTDRSGSVHIKNHCSNYHFFNVGVPQGSVLGPLMFLLYINDIESCLVNGAITLYADDANVFFSERNKYNLERSINLNLIKIEEWLCVNKLILDIKKSKYIVFCLRKSFDINVKFGNVTLEREECIKFLGIFIDNKLNWSYHIDFVKNKIIPIAAVMYDYATTSVKTC
jgi:hypothetical protein